VKLTSSAEVKNDGAISLNCPIRLYRVVLN
jgi:hypothetical protein